MYNTTYYYLSKYKYEYKYTRVRGLAGMLTRPLPGGGGSWPPCLSQCSPCASS